MTSVQPPRAFGSSIKRKEDQRFITGTGRYTDDVVLPGQAHAYSLRSPLALARDKVRFVGEPFAVVIAETLQIARDAAELIDVDS